MPNLNPSTSVAIFSLDTRTVDGDFVIREGKVFELGAWPDKGFALDGAEADAAIAVYAPVDNDLEHRKTILDGHLGKLDSVRRDGTELFGRIRIPKWLDTLQGDKPIGVSLAWNAAKQIVGNALTLNPRITDAQVAAAFSADTNLEATEAYEFFIEFAGRRNSAKDGKDIQAVHDLTLKLGAVCTPKEEVEPAFTQPKEKPKKMKVSDFLAIFGLGHTPNPDAEFTLPASFATPVNPLVPPVVPPVVPPAAAFSAELETLRGEIKVARDSSLMNSAKAFCAELRAAHKIVPAQEPAIIAAFCMSARDDAKGQPGYVEGLACFSATGDLVEGERLKTLRGQYTAAPVLNFTSELLGGTEQTVLFDATNDTKLTPEGLAALLNTTNLGQSALAALKENK